MKLLENKVAIITGAGSGIGRAMALLYAGEGAKVVVADLDEKGGKETVEKIVSTGGEAFFQHIDTSNTHDNKKLVEQTLSKYKRLNIAVNNAGIGGPVELVAKYPLDGWDKVISINLSGVFYGLHYQIPAIAEAGGGSIVNVASILGAVGTKRSPAYVASKHGVDRTYQSGGAGVRRQKNTRQLHRSRLYHDSIGIGNTG